MTGTARDDVGCPGGPGFAPSPVLAQAQHLARTRKKVRTRTEETARHADRRWIACAILDPFAVPFLTLMPLAFLLVLVEPEGGEGAVPARHRCSGAVALLTLVVGCYFGEEA
ncbi:MAG: hypothetical protein NZM40_07505 [Sphingomonadaceae bacterium]|uniref:hypothetical protein n=1 Tax=Thermaurantiacus sp. TaxID=2820283 RepID=UPI00298F1D73|nr:hypothetical protein [Thermaurantiacus sp.]MCS6987257.1 hypothetical protein [Sphingomonadaceae bacterium]MDW8414477.1 hypothetical protein [Thermaurantiacus sp.]